MKRALLLLLLILATTGCPAPANMPPPKVIAAHVLGKTANTAAVELNRIEQEEGDKAIGVAASLEEAQAALRAIEEKWLPLWRAFDLFAGAHSTYVDALEGNNAEAAKQAKIVLRTAYCALREVAKPKLPLPDHPTEPCP